MKIAIAINRSWNIYNFREGIVRSLLDDGHSVLAVAPEDDYTEKLIDWGCEFEPLEVAATGANPFREANTIFRFRRILKRHKIDVLLTYTIKFNIYGIIATRYTGIPCICNVSGLGTVFLSNGVVSGIARILYRLTFRFAGHIFFQNEEDFRDFTTFINLKENRTSVLPGSGINLKRFPKLDYQPGNPSRFLMISRLLIDKGVTEYIRAAREVMNSYPKTRFVLVGGLDPDHKRSVDRDWLNKFVQDGIIEYHDHTDDIPAFIGRADALVLPSYREGTPRTLLEGGASGRPLIATDVPGCREVVEHDRNGFLCKVKNVSDLAETLIKFIELSNKMKVKMAEESRRIVEEKFDEAIVVREYREKISAVAT